MASSGVCVEQGWHWTPKYTQLPRSVHVHKVETVKQSGPWGSLCRYVHEESQTKTVNSGQGRFSSLMAIMYLLKWLCFYSSGKTVTLWNSNFQIKFDIEGRGQSTPRQYGKQYGFNQVVLPISQNIFPSSITFDGDFILISSKL